MVYFTLYIVTTLAALGSVLNLDKKNWKQIRSFGIFYTLYCDDPSCVRLSFKFGQKKTENRFDPLIFFIITQMNHDPLYI